MPPKTDRARPLDWEWLGRRPYGEVHAAQQARREQIIAGRAPEVLWLLEHDPVVTVGRRPAPGTPDAATLASHGIDFHRTERGGLATWHGPGQLVLYALVDLVARGLGVRGLVAALEDGVMATLDELGLPTARRCGFPGVWARGDKLCAVGLHIRRGVSMHGLALNLTPDLGGYELIVPCGVTDAHTTSVARLLGQAPSPEALAAVLASHVRGAILGLDVHLSGQ